VRVDAGHVRIEIGDVTASFAARAPDEGHQRCYVRCIKAPPLRGKVRRVGIGTRTARWRHTRGSLLSARCVTGATGCWPRADWWASGERARAGLASALEWIQLHPMAVDLAQIWRLFGSALQDHSTQRLMSMPWSSAVAALRGKKSYRVVTQGAVAVATIGSGVHLPIMDNCLVNPSSHELINGLSHLSGTSDDGSISAWSDWLPAYRDLAYLHRVGFLRQTQAEAEQVPAMSLRICTGTNNVDCGLR
jgi:hypothetical protein